MLLLTILLRLDETLFDPHANLIQLAVPLYECWWGWYGSSMWGGFFGFALGGWEFTALFILCKYSHHKFIAWLSAMMLGHWLCHLFLDPLVKIKKTMVSPNVWIDSESLQPDVKAHIHKWHTILVPVPNNTKQVIVHMDANFSKRFANSCGISSASSAAREKILTAS